MPTYVYRPDYWDQAASVDPARIQQMARQGLRLNKYVREAPSLKQRAFLSVAAREAFYGGAAGGGKSSALLMAALQYVDRPGYAALLLRRTFRDLNLPGALMDRSKLWLSGTDAEWNDNDHQWTFPSGATITFGYLLYEVDKYHYQSAEFQFIGFDELSQFSETQYLYLFSRLRRKIGMEDIPLRMRSASNPGGAGHDWVNARFVDPKTRDPSALFIPAKLTDNPGIDAEDYIQNLGMLDPVTQAQLLEGDWEIIAEGNKFRRAWWDFVDEVPRECRRLRFWDLAATEKMSDLARGRTTDPDWTCGVLLGELHGIYYVIDVVRIQANPGEVKKTIQQTAYLDGLHTSIVMEQEPGASGKTVIAEYAQHVLQGFDFTGYLPSGNKVVRANPWSAAVYNGLVKLRRARWNRAFLEEHEAFPSAAMHDDQVDAASGAYTRLSVQSQLEYVGAVLHENRFMGNGGRPEYRDPRGFDPDADGF